MDHRFAALMILCTVFLLIGVFIGWANWESPAAKRGRQQPPNVRQLQAIRTIELIDEIVQNRDGWFVTLCGDNPEFDNGPNVIVDVFGEWPDQRGGEKWKWCERQFSAVTRVDALRKALAAITELDV